LWVAYLEFYESELAPEVTEDVFTRLVGRQDLFGAIAWNDQGEALGLVHWLFHPSTWSTGPYCYLEDLYVSPTARGAGVGQALIAHVSEAARAQGAAKVYWLTHESNQRARSVYDRVAERTGFIHYQREL
jgi:GNAT superfamily N-acetyltransferase